MGNIIKFDSASGPGVEEDLLLRFLIKRGEQSLMGTPPKQTSPWWSLSAAAVHFDKKLVEKYSEEE